MDFILVFNQFLYFCDKRKMSNIPIKIFRNENIIKKEITIFPKFFREGIFKVNLICLNIDYFSIWNNEMLKGISLFVGEIT